MLLRFGVGTCQLLWVVHRLYLSLSVSAWRSVRNYQPSRWLDLEMVACLRCFCLSGFYAAAAADRGQDVVGTSGGWSRRQAPAGCWSSGLRSERSYIHGYMKQTLFFPKESLGSWSSCVCAPCACVCCSWRRTKGGRLQPDRWNADEYSSSWRVALQVSLLSWCFNLCWPFVWNNMTQTIQSRIHLNTHPLNNRWNITTNS